MDNPVDKVVDKHRLLDLVDKCFGCSQLIHSFSTEFLGIYPQPQFDKAEVLIGVIHISTGPTTTTTNLKNSFKESLVVKNPGS